MEAFQSELERAVLTALRAGASTRPGNGQSALVEWNKDSRTITTTTGVQMTRSKSVGLAHELIHASYDASGLQMGVDNGHDTTALYEYMCVGLGVWAGNTYSENAIRAVWNTVTKYKVGPKEVKYSALAARPAY